MDWRDARIGASVGNGWISLVDELHKKMLALDPDYFVQQVKEKFGGLRFYWHSNASEEIRSKMSDLEAEAEKASFTICEQCGKPGQLRGDGWLKTYCDEHSKGRPVLEEDED